MLRKIIRIDEEKCSGCGACAAACHEGAIAMVDGKARLTREDYCDGLGDCLPACPVGAISFEEREAAAYDSQAVAAAQSRQAPAGGCPGSQARLLRQESAPAASAPAAASELRQWPVQIKLSPVQAPCFDGCDLLIAADCTAYAYGSFHQDFMRGRVTLIGCPKLDGVDYSEKLTRILQANDIRSLTVIRMEVPCCGGLENAVKRALQASGKRIPWQVVTVATDGRLLQAGTRR
ncbi:MAG: 4Fe-4S binding protein [Firmicutes bacterium]|nr:4Fe-4S binding protein [Bacillota bacterium]